MQALFSNVHHKNKAKKTSSKPEIHKEIQRNFLRFNQCGFGEFVISEIEIPDINIEVIGCVSNSVTLSYRMTCYTEVNYY